jgi:hypothetical protein
MAVFASAEGWTMTIVERLDRAGETAKGAGPGRMAAFAFAAMAMAALPREARAEPPAPALLERLSHHADSFEKILHKASFRFDQVMNELDGDGKVAGTRTMTAHIETDGTTSHEVIDRCVKDGKDVTAEEREKVKKAEDEEEKKKGKKTSGGDEEADLKMPFLASEQALYVFDQKQVDPNDPTRVEISFTPKKPDKHTIEGAAWVNAADGTVISAGVKLSKPPTFVDFVHLTAEFGEKTPLGPALSRLTVDAKGGFLFIHKHFKGEVRMSEYRVAP